MEGFLLNREENKCFAGAFELDITPEKRQFLWGYPHVERYSRGIHDRLTTSSLYVDDGKTRVLFIANDIIFVNKTIVGTVRKRIHEATGIPEGNILVSATHTHSGPMIVKYVSNCLDPAIPEPDPDYLLFLMERMVEGAKKAVEVAVPARIGFSLADGTGIGGNRRNPHGPFDPDVPVLIAVEKQSGKKIGIMVVFSMHPTVLHEDNLYITADFPGEVKQYLKHTLCAPNLPIIYHTGPSGNQSPRYVISSNTFEESAKLGRMLGARIQKAFDKIVWENTVRLSVTSSQINLPRKTFETLEASMKKLRTASRKVEQLREHNAPVQQIRTAEVDWFGAEETVALVRSLEDGTIEKYYTECLPAEIQVVAVGSRNYVAWPGEFFVEYALMVKKKHTDTYVISLANGELQGYIVTAEAAAEGGYEASNCLFAHESGGIVVAETEKLLAEISSPAAGKRR